MTPALPEGCQIALLGAPGTGRSSLAQALSDRLAARGMDHVRVVEQVLPDTGSGASIVLLMGLDLPCPPAATSGRESADTELRAALGRAGIPYSVIHGQGPQRLAAAWNAILARAEAASGESDPVDGGAPRPAGATAARPWSWSCEKCSDPACEHRLFSDLLALRN